MRNEERVVSENSIKYYSTNLKSPEVTFREALLKGLAPDGGLYVPVRIPKISTGGLEALSSKTYPETAFVILEKFLGDEIDRDYLHEICADVYRFNVPLEKIYNRIYIMRLDQGPTASFKDFAALLMGRLMQYFLELDNQHITILTATSGDTGSAVASAFYGLENIRVVILFPKDEVTEMQRKQMTTLKNNIQVIAINGKFDDCQRLVKKAFIDTGLSRISLSSANSINIGRLLPQSVYYFYAWSKLSEKTIDPMVFSVPSGNFGNLTGGLIAREMGLPVKCFVVATNKNDEVPVYLSTGEYNIISPSKNCISSAMNVGHPSNLARIIALYGGRMDETGMIVKTPDLSKMRKELSGVSISENNTRHTIEDFYRKYGLLLEPHGAVAWMGLQEYLKNNPGNQTEDQLCVSLETAHPAKFSNEIFEILKLRPSLPYSISKIIAQEEEFISLENDYDAFRSYIIKNY